MTGKRASLPYDFVLEELSGLEISTKPMFGCHSIYVGDKIVFIQRLKEKPPEDDGVWIATTPGHHESLRREFPNMRSISVFGPGETAWQVLPASAEDFEESVLRACELVRSGDERIGKIPKSRISKGLKKKATKRKAKASKKR